MDFEEILKKGEEMWFIKNIKRKMSYSFKFNNSQFYIWLNKDKKGLKDLIKAEKLVEKSSKYYLWKKIWKPLWEYSITSYFVNFQYFVELLNLHGIKMWLTKKILIHNNNWWEDLYISLRLSLMWHYKSSFFHLRSFMENYFQMVWEYSIKVWKVDTETKEFKWINNTVKNKFRYLTSSEKNKKLTENNINLDYLFNWEVYVKIYNYLSEYAHNKKQIKNNYSDTIMFNEEIFDKYMRLSWLVMLLTIRLVYWFMKKEMEKQWIKVIQNPIPYERNYYRYIIWEMVYWDMFYLLYEDKISRDFFKKEVKIDVEKLYPKLKESIKEMKMFDKLNKKAGWNHDKFLDLFWERIDKKNKKNLTKNTKETT